MSRPLYTVSVTKLEAFRLWQHGQTEDNESWNTEQKLIDTLKGVYTPSDKAKFGSAYHLIIEKPKLNRWTTNDNQRGYMIDGMFINESQATPALHYAVDHPMMRREVNTFKQYTTLSSDWYVTGKIDAMEGLWLRDTKCKFSALDMQEYISSMQWRFYLDMENCDVFFYDLFQVRGFKTIADVPTCRVEGIEPMMLKRYPDMESDLSRLLQEFADYIDFKKFHEYVEISPISDTARKLGLYPDMVWNDDTVITWGGKYRGFKLGEKPDYLKWLYENRPLPAALRTYIRTKFKAPTNRLP